MSKRVAYIFKGCISDGVNPEPLKHLDNNVKKIKEVLEENGAWKVKCFNLDNAETLKSALSDVMEVKDIEEFLFYYTGHGKGTKDAYYLIGENEKRINLLDAFSLHDTYTQKVSVIVDACESHTLINIWDNRRPYELFVATKTGLAHEGNLSEMSDFSHCFYEAFQNIVQDSFQLLDIHQYMKGRLSEQESDYNPTKSRVRSVIGYNKEINQIKKLLQQKIPISYDFKKKLLEYLEKDNLGFQKILSAENFNELLLLALKYNKPSLSCIFKEFGIEHGYLGEFSELGCMELRNKAEGNLDVKKVIVRITSNNGKSNDCTLKGWLQNSIDALDSLATQNIDFTSDYISVLAKYIKEPLANKTLAYNPLELDLILDDMLMDYDFYPLNCVEYSFIITIQFLNRKKRVMSVWKQNSDFFEQKKEEKIVDYVLKINDLDEKDDIENCFLDDKILIDSSYNLLTVRYIEMIKSLGLPFVLTPTSDIETKIEYNWEDKALKDLKRKSTRPLKKHYRNVKKDDLDSSKVERKIQFIYDNYHDSIKLKTLLQEINETIK